ncbi:MAG TPA: penicillin acylase family protein [Bacteroidota bacterium]|nr:penicillin acylase family protein [Bacteroidota bacterium]
MSQFAKICIGMFFTLLLVLIAGFFLLRNIVTKSFPETRGRINVPGLHAAVDVYRDDYGVPHVQAQDEHDLMFAVGYVHAQDRLWQMDIARRAGEGRLSEVLGSATVEFDALFRTLDLRGVAENIQEHLHPESRAMLDAYTEGVNGFIDTHAGKYPIEFDMLRYRPERWEVRHSILVGRLIAWELNLAWWTDLTYGEIASKVPLQKLDQIIPTYPDSIPAIVRSGMLKKALAEVFGSIKEGSVQLSGAMQERLPGVHQILEIGRSYRDFFGLGPLESGSNAWVVGASRSMSGKPLLASDPHLAMPAPSRWYELHLSAPGWNVAGVSLPGAPLVIIGHNEHVAWGLTNAMIDDADFYIERPDTSKGKGGYIFQKSTIPFEERDEKIFIGASDSVIIKVRSTRHGPIINDVHPMHNHHDRDSLRQRTPIAMRWTGLDVSDELYGFYLLNRASTPVEFERGLKEIAVPGQCVVYGDVQGNIAYWTTGHIPIRGKQSAMLPLPGWTGDAEWKGFVPFNELPKLFNPPEGLIACANQKITDKSFSYYISTLWEPPSRIQRILQLLHSAEKFTPEDFKEFQHDDVSLYARDVAQRVLRAYDGVQVDDPDVTNALSYLRNWDFRFAQSDVAATIFNSFFVRLLHNTYEDEMGPDLFRDFVYFGAIPYRVTGQLLAQDSSSWFDDVRTPQRETKNEIVRKSLVEGLHELKQTLGDEMKTWRWGALHTVTFAHPFGSVKPLDKVFNIGPFAISGGETTIMSAEYRLSAPYAVSVGPTMRQVIDMAEPLTADMVITSGESGQPLFKHYNDQTPLWLTGGYHKVTIDWNEIKKSSWDHLVLSSQ